MLLEYIKNSKLVSTTVDKIPDFRQLNFLFTSETALLSMPEILDYIKLSEVDNFINLAVSKLAHGGIIKIGGTNIDAVCRARVNGLIHTNELTNYLYGAGTNAWDCKVSAYAPQDIRQKLESLNLYIQSYRINDFKFCIEGVRR